MSNTAGPREIRALEIDGRSSGNPVDVVSQLYDDQLDVVVIRDALSRSALAAAGERLDRDDEDPGWARPYERVAVEDIQILGTDTPAMPTDAAPAGASLDAYLASAERHRDQAQRVFDEEDFEAAKRITELISRFAGGRPVETAKAADGREFVPFTVRRLVHGKQIGPHHDYHYPLALYDEIAPTLDTRTLISFVFVLRRPEAGGELCVYAVTPDTPDPPKMPNGFMWDLEAVERRYHFQRFALDVGDVFLLASGRCLHRIAPIVGSRARVSMGGFLALSKERDRLFYWS